MHSDIHIVQGKFENSDTYKVTLAMEPSVMGQIEAMCHGIKCWSYRRSDNRLNRNGMPNFALAYIIISHINLMAEKALS